GGALNLLHCVHGRHPCDGGTVFLTGSDNLADNFLCNKGPDTVVNEHQVLRSSDNCSQRVGHGVLAMLATFDYLQPLLENLGILLFQLSAKARYLVFS